MPVTTPGFLVVRTPIGGGIGTCPKGLTAPSRPATTSDSTKRLFRTPGEAFLFLCTEPKLCVTVTAATTAELRERRDRVKDADLVELRLDTVRDPSAAGALSDRRTPVVVTCRAEWEGGQFRGSEEERQRHPSRGAGARRRLRRCGVARTLRRSDRRAQWPRRGDLDARFRGRARRPRVALRRDAAHRRRGREGRGHGRSPDRLHDASRAHSRRTGQRPSPSRWARQESPTRILPRRFGSSLDLSLAKASRPDRYRQRRFSAHFSFRSITARTAIYGVVGRPVEHSISPAMHNAAFRAAGLDAVYLPLGRLRTSKTSSRSPMRSRSKARA